MKSHTINQQPLTGAYGDSLETISGDVRQLLRDPISDSPRWLSQSEFKLRRTAAFKKNVQSREVQKIKAEERKFRSFMSSLESGKKVCLGGF